MWLFRRPNYSKWGGSAGKHHRDYIDTWGGIGTPQKMHRPVPVL